MRLRNSSLSRPCWKLRKQQLPKGCLILKDTKSKLAQTQAWKAGVKKIMQRQRQIELQTAALNYATYPTDAAFERARSTKRKVTVATCPVGSRVHCPSLHRTKQAAIELLQQELGYTPSYVVKSRSMSRQEIGSSAYNASEKIHVSNIPPWPDFKSAEHQIQATESCIRKALVMLGVPMFDVEARIRDCTLMCKIGMPGADTVLQVPLFLLSLSIIINKQHPIIIVFRGWAPGITTPALYCLYVFNLPARLFMKYYIVHKHKAYSRAYPISGDPCSTQAVSWMDVHAMHRARVRSRGS